MSSLKRYEGYLLTDHSQGPGLNQRYPNQLKVEEATLWCGHCGTPFIKNLNRERPREYCRLCDIYMCDCCAAATKQPVYIHRSIKEIIEIVRRGQFTVSGSLSNPLLIPVFTP